MSEPVLSKKPLDKPFQQQRLVAWQPLLTPMWVIGTFIVVGCIFIPIGAVVLAASNSVVEFEVRYDNIARNTSCNVNFNNNTNCNVKFEATAPADMQAPFYCYYKLTNVYQNHRRYVKSRSDPQLRGQLGVDIANCEPVEKMTDSTGSKTIYPCGLIANSFFNDTIYGPSVFRNGVLEADFSNPAENNVNWNGQGIAWASDVADKFVKVEDLPSSYTRFGPNGLLPSVTNEDFIVWMRTAGLSTFKKLYRKVGKTSLKKGDVLKFTAQSLWNVDTFHGTKSVVCSTTAWIGGKNTFLGVAYITVGAFALALAIVFAVKHNLSPRQLGDLKHFNLAGVRSQSH